MQVDVREAETQLCRLLEIVEGGETVTITRDGKPVADLVPSPQVGFPLGVAAHDPLVPSGDDWWKPMSDEEADAWTNGQ